MYLKRKQGYLLNYFDGQLIRNSGGPVGFGMKKDCFFPLFEKEDMRDERKSCVEMCFPYILSLPDTEKTRHF